MRATLEIVGMVVGGEGVTKSEGFLGVTLKAHAILNMHEGGVRGQ